MLLTRQTSPAVAAPVLWADAKAHLRLSDTSEQALVEGLIEAATLHAEAYSHRAARANVWVMLRESFLDEDGAGFTLPVADVASVTTIERLVANVWTVVPSTVWELKRSISRSHVVEKVGQSWPADADDVSYPVRVTFVQAAGMPAGVLKAGILRHVAALFADRGDAEPVVAGGSPDGWTRPLSIEVGKQSGAEALYAPFSLQGF